MRKFPNVEFPPPVPAPRLGYPALPNTHNYPREPPSSSFPLHTYLGLPGAIKKALRYDSNPALHIAAVRAVEYTSVSSRPQFLMVLFSEFLFVGSLALMLVLEEELREMVLAQASLGSPSYLITTQYIYGSFI